MSVCVFAHVGSAAPATNDVKLAKLIWPPRSTHSPQITLAPVDPPTHTHTHFADIFFGMTIAIPPLRAKCLLNPVSGN